MKGETKMTPEELAKMIVAQEAIFMKITMALCKLLNIDPMDLGQVYHEFVMENPDWHYENAEEFYKMLKDG